MRSGLRDRLCCAALLAVVGACTAPTSETDGSREQRAALDGTWKSDGYGYVVVATADQLQTYEVTETTCVRSFVAKKRADAVPGVDAAYAVDDQVLLLTLAADRNEMRIHAEGAASDVVFHCLADRPPLLDAQTPDTPAGNFEVFARTWSEHYILFDEKHVDWSAVVERARAKVTPATTPDELFEIFAGMIAPFEDAHTMIAAEPIERRFRSLRAGTDRVAKHGLDDFMTKDLPAIHAVTDARLVGPMQKFCGDRIHYGHLDDSTGYLRILGEGGYTADGGFATGLVALESALDAIFGDPKLERLVIDVRINGGGADPYGLALAARLATTEYVAYSKEARNDPVDRRKWTRGQPSIVRPSTRPSFHGPVVELTGPLTISAGETLTQALMGRTPKVVRIGENTQGVFSDVLVRTLPNGWRFGLPNEVFRTSDGKTFDGPGIPPDITVPVFADDDLAAGRDPALERARIELSKQR